MAGKVLAFRRGSSSVQGLRFLYIENQGEEACFCFKKGATEYYFHVHRDGLLEVEKVVDSETYEEVDSPLPQDVCRAAKSVAEEQFKCWDEASGSERISLSITWYRDIFSDLEKLFLERIQRFPFAEQLEDLHDLLREMLEVDSLILGLETALEAL